MNPSLIKSLSYSIEKVTSALSYVSERKFKELHTRRIHDLEGMFKQFFQQQKFDIIISAPQYFEMPTELTVFKQSLLDGMTKGTTNSILVVYKPIEAGEIPLKIVRVEQIELKPNFIKSSQGDNNSSNHCIQE